MHAWNHLYSKDEIGQKFTTNKGQHDHNLCTFPKLSWGWKLPIFIKHSLKYDIMKYSYINFECKSNGKPFWKLKFQSIWTDSPLCMEKTLLTLLRQILLILGNIPAYKASFHLWDISIRQLEIGTKYAISKASS